MKKLASAALSIVLSLSVFPTAAAFAVPGHDKTLSVNSEFCESDADALLEKMDAAEEGDIADDSLIVTLKEGAAIPENAIESSGASVDVISNDDDGKILQICCDEKGSVPDVVNSLVGDSSVASVEPNYLYKLIDSGNSHDSADAFMTQFASSQNAYAVNDPYANSKAASGSTPNQWYLDSINAQGAWGVSRASGAVTVAVIDSGINYSHEDLAGVVDKANARQFYYKNIQTQDIASAPYYSSETSEEYGHGTHIAGVISAEANNGRGFAGVSYNARILPIKTFFDYGGESYTTDALVAHAYNYIFDLVKSGRTDIKVINLSLGGDNVNTALMNCITKAKNTYNILTVCAAGNDGVGTPVYPADLDECISVTAVNANGTRADFSNYGTAKDIAAPGVGIWSTWVGSSSAVKTMNGTSIAAPMVSACAALLWSYNPRLSVDEVKGFIYSTSKSLPPSEEYIGRGILDVGAALNALASTLPAKRITQGTTAMDTSAAISKQSFTRSNAVVIACDNDFADSMSATGLAGVLGSPILLSSQNGISALVADEIRRLGATKAYVIGGERALPSAGVISSLRSAGITSTERVKGTNSWDTSVECAKKITALKKAKGDSDFGKIVMATSSSFQDAVSMSSFAYKYSVPIFLQTGFGPVQTRVLNEEAMNLINTEYKDATIYVPGGRAAVATETAEGIFNVDGANRVVRLTEGKTAYDTSNAIAKYMVSSGLLSGNTVTIACGADSGKGVDALAGGSIAGLNSSPVLLVNADDSSEPVDKTVINGFITDNKSMIDKAYILGGRAAISQDCFVEIAYTIR